MKYYKKIALLTLASLALVTGCGKNESNTTTSKTDSIETKKNSKEQPETVSFFADGEYEVGIDIKPGSYYVVLTEFQAEKEYDEVYFKYGTNLDIDDDNYDFEDEGFKTIGKPYKITFKDGMKFSFGSNEGISNWSVSFFTADDYKEYQSSEKK